MRPFVLPVLLALGVMGAPVLAAPCKDAKGRFIKCPAAKKTPARCKDARGRFGTCASSGAKPI